MDPKEERIGKFYRKLFMNNKDLFDEFMELFNAAVEDGSTKPEDVAMIHFRDKYVEIDEEPGWIERTV